ncbi:hypothetical protein [Kitasatospora nipponensis]
MPRRTRFAVVVLVVTLGLTGVSCSVPGDPGNGSVPQGPPPSAGQSVVKPKVKPDPPVSSPVTPTKPRVAKGPVAVTACQTARNGLACRITGSGFLPDELLILEYDSDVHQSTTIQAEDDGRFVHDLKVLDSSLPTIRVTVTGKESRLSASTSYRIVA